MTHQFSFGDYVIVDGDAGIKMRVTAVTYRNGSETWECSYFNNGVLVEVWLPAWRLKLVDRRPLHVQRGEIQ